MSSTETNRDWLCGLPLNRKERYYTGTVLPGLIAADDFAHLDRFLRLFELDVNVEPENLVFFTEYGFAESVFTEEDRKRWLNNGEKIPADTPDVVIAGPDWLLAVEAKMFHNPSAADLNEQMARQSAVVRRWIDVLELADDRVKHALLLPSQLGVSSTDLNAPVVTWERVLDEYRDRGPRYWSRALETALASYSKLASVGAPSGQNKDGVLTGLEIVEMHGRGTLQYKSVGRGGGLKGDKFASDLQDGAWRVRSYEVRYGEPPNPNWFTVDDFIAATATK